MGGSNGEPERTVNRQEVPGQAIASVLRKLERAYQYSRDCQRKKWDFAVEIAGLENLGVSHDELRWLVGKGLVDQAREISGADEPGRRFEQPGGFSFAEQSCFVITNKGLRVAQELNRQGTTDGLSLPIEPQAMAMVTRTPTWDDQRHELRVGHVLVKRFRWRATNQEAILAAFHEEGWPARIDDPLSPVSTTDPKRRLSDTIKCLNRKQQNCLVRFSGDGTGEGVVWNIVDPADLS